MLVLHIGAHKTGTSAIQGALARADAMREMGVNFVEAGRNGRMAHHELAWSIRGRHKIPLSVWDGVRKELAADPTPIKVLSSEAFWYENPLEIKRQLAWKGDVKIVVYLQRQDRYLQGLYQQTLAAGKAIAFDEWMKEMGHRGEYLGVIDEWAEQFGRAAIAVRPFERGGERGDEQVDAVKDFFAVLGLDARNAGLKPLTRAPQAPPSVQHFLRAAAKAGLDEAKLHGALMKRNRAYGQHNDAMPHREAQALMARYDRTNRALAEKYWGADNGPLFPALVETAPAGGETLDDPAFFALTVDALGAVMELVASQAGPETKRKKQLS
ncbi:MAG TPA: hypothetical protein VG889_17470 [Rhizomicrobium sp.]|nr:hypothetical protein [Rhizomicrobium sp.]